MDHEVYLMTERMQDAHWWFLGRRSVLESVMRSAAGDAGDILDVGCGTGANLAWISGFGKARGIDPAEEAVSACRARGLDVTKGTLPDAAVAPGSIGAVTLFDVLEHIDDDRAMLREIAAVLKPGGKLVMSVPAWPWLWGGHDVTHHHKRRYRAADLEAKLVAAGFRVRYLSYFNLLLSPPIVVARLAERLLSRKGQEPESGLKPVAAPLNALLRRVFSLESALVPRVRLPFGISLVAVAEKA